MKVRNVLCIGLSAALLSPLAFADVQSNAPGHLSGTAATTANAIVSSNTAPAVESKHRGKTRAEVHQELLLAQKAGLIPTTDADYPPSERTIERNKRNYAASGRN
ncbi:DUF4148 domain-containing protein [Paraburkholderia antibiotica]|uniref:DUF4148 domain-containing protein n=1 Tax=Paraburkholderia antibiotica TaxID=2728839 RepID=A0A7X9X301_9BURK|nr:DUF4148 domain-containing protein [Paraburkholderia antibiotica]NML30508.1 DUF4148 domain-containing protein [Paraburkholderia antibiotica]